MLSVSVVFEIVLALIPAIALLWRGGAFGGDHNPKDMFAYYTNLSNLVVCVYYAARCVLRAVKLTDGIFYSVFFSATSQYAVTLCITATFVIYHFILRPIVIRRRDEYEEFCNFFSPTNILVHYVVPLTTLIYWLVFGLKKGLTVYSIFAWIALPVLYTIYAFVRAPIKGNIYKTSSPYPYEFLDPIAIGWKKVFRWIAVVTVAFFAVGYLFILLARFLDTL